MEKITIGIVALVIILGGWFIINKEPETKTNNKNTIIKTNSGNGKLELVSENNFDFGEILMKGGDVKINYTLKNTGTDPVKIINSETSCACTVAKIFDKDGKGYGPFGMQGGAHAKNPSINLEILPGEEVTVEATYDPLAHGPDATGKLIREVFVNTDTGEKLRLKFRGEGVKEFSKVNGPSLAFTNKEYDFGGTKQSEGDYQTSFKIFNNGSEEVIVDSLPTSCECVTAKIDKKNIKPGESAIIDINFDANLHPEPKGRFYKTIEIVSNIKPTPELKVYASVDYDLGMDKLKLQKHD